MSARSGSINLLPPSDFERSSWGKFLKWAIGTGRYIIIVTELVVIGAFLSRFKLDRELANLSAEIEGRKNVLTARAGVEKRFGIVQGRLDAASGLMASQMGVGGVLEKIVEKIPPGPKLSNLTIKGNRISLTATTYNEREMGEALSRMANEPSWKGVELTEVNADKEKGIRFSVKISL